VAVTKRESLNQALKKEGIDLAKDLARLLKNEKSLYKKAHKALTQLLLVAPGAKLEGKQNGKQVSLTISQVTANQQKYFERYVKVLEVVMRYTYPSIKAIEVKASDEGRIAFNISIPEPQKPEKGKEKGKK